MEYDETGRLVAYVDSEGRRTEIDHDPDSRQETVTDRLGNVTIYRYDDDGNVIEVIDALGGRTLYTYDENGNLSSVTNPEGSVTRYEYDDDGNRTAVVDPMGERWISSFDEEGNRLSVTDPEGNVNRWTYDDAGRVVTFTDATGAMRRTEYDSDGNMTRFEDGTGSVFTAEYEPSGALSEFTDAAGVHWTLTNNALGHPTRDNHVLTTRAGDVAIEWAYSWDPGGQLASITTPGGATLETEVDELGQIAGAVDARGNRWVFERDGLNRMRKRVSPSGTEYRTDYDAENREVAITLPGGGRIEKTYDALDRVTGLTLSDGANISRTYDGAGRVVTETDPLGHVTRFTHNAAGGVLSEERPGGATKRYTYDGRGLVSAVTDAEGGDFGYEYDGEGRVIRSTFPDGESVEHSYDGEGRVLTRTVASAGEWSFSYSSAGLPESVADPLGGITTYGHDSHGMFDEITDANGHLTSFVFDGLGNRLQRTLPGGGIDRWSYDGESNLISHTRPDGGTIAFEYDVNGRMIERSSPDGETEVREYDDDDALVSVTNRLGRTRIVRDARGRITLWSGPDELDVSYDYDAAGNPTRVTTDAGDTTYGYDDFGLATVTDPWGNTTRIGRDRLGRPVTTNLPNGVTIERELDGIGRTIRITSTSEGGEVLADLAYARDASGRVTGLRDVVDGREVAYAYDALERLVEERISPAEGPEETIRYVYDAVGNMTSRSDGSGISTLEYDEDHRLVSDGTWEYGWDANGNLASRSDGSVTESFTHDDYDRLVRVDRDGAMPARIDYVYDNDGLLVSRTADGVQTRYVWNRAFGLPQLIEVRDGTGSLIARYEHDGGRLLSRNDPSEDGLGTFLADHLGTVHAEIDSSGSVIGESHSDAWGRGREDAVRLERGYLGELTDPDTGMVFLRARWYSPSMMRFIEPDPADAVVDDTRTLNRYVYSLDDPVNHFDPTGLFTMTEVAAVVGIVGILASLALQHYHMLGEQIAVFLGFGDAFTMHNHAAKVFPFLSAGWNVIVGGMELLWFDHGEWALYAYAGLGTTRSLGWTVSLNMAIGDVFDTPTSLDYRGWFVSITASAAFLESLGQHQGVHIISNTGGAASIFWSPTPTIAPSAGSGAHFSHGYSVNLASVGVGRRPGRRGGLKGGISIALTHYFYLTSFGTRPRPPGP